MAIFNSDEAEGKWEQTKGTVKDKVGELTGNERLEAEGDAQNASGDAQRSTERWRRSSRELGQIQAWSFRDRRFGWRSDQRRR